MSAIIVTGSFDDLRSRHVRFLEEAGKLGDLHVLLWSDDLIRRATGQPPKFPQEERRYLVEAIRFVSRVSLVEEDLTGFPSNLSGLAVDEADDTPAHRAFCAARGLAYHVFTSADLAGFPVEAEVRRQVAGGIPAPADHRVPPSPCHPVTRSPCHPVTASPGHRVIVTGCYDWLHSGHVRFFEEASTYGDLIVVVGNDANVRHLKGKGHPLQTQEERRYMVGAIRYVKQALISTGWDWLDAEPEIRRLKPDIYVVNEDGDRPEKREFCAQHGLQYVVLKRAPKEGLPRRSSTALRGF